tara:strand:+ start:2487 stop:2678 length:192 start_codon:yes stop_codon:yes gene_type:complete
MILASDFPTKHNDFENGQYPATQVEESLIASYEKHTRVLQENAFRRIAQPAHHPILGDQTKTQ